MKKVKIKYKMVRVDEGTYKLLEDLKVKLSMRDKLPYFSYEIIRMALQLLKEKIESEKKSVFEVNKSDK
jgi:hypothetical protein